MICQLYCAITFNYLINTFKFIWLRLGLHDIYFMVDQGHVKGIVHLQLQVVIDFLWGNKNTMQVNGYQQL